MLAQYIRAALLAIAALAFSGCSALEPRPVKFTPPQTGVYDDAKNEAQKVRKILSKRAWSAQKEDVFYEFIAIGTGAAGVVTAVYGAPTDLITSLALGAATFAGWDLYWNPEGVKDQYENGSSAITCSIQVTDAIRSKTQTAASLAPAGTTFAFASDQDAARELNEAVDLILEKLRDAINARTRDKSALLPATLLQKKDEFNTQVAGLSGIASQAEVKNKVSGVSVYGPEFGC